MKYLERLKQIEIDGNKIYLKKNMFGGYRVVSPIKNEDGTFNWFNFLTGGSWGKLISLILIILLISFMAWSYYHDISMCKELITCGAKCSNKISELNLTTYLP